MPSNDGPLPVICSGLKTLLLFGGEVNLSVPFDLMAVTSQMFPALPSRRLSCIITVDSGIAVLGAGACVTRIVAARSLAPPPLVMFVVVVLFHAKNCLAVATA